MAIMIIGGFEFSETCPEECPGKADSGDQGGLCYRCPVFNCEKHPVDEADKPYYGDFIQLLEPKDYRSDWAEVWYNWFKDGMKDYPVLYL